MRTTACPRCDRDTYVIAGRYERHPITPHLSDWCPMGNQRETVTGTSPHSYEARADLVADLAEQVQDADPAVVWDYLTALPAVELQRLLMVTLAGLPIDRTLADIFDWVYELPAAKVVAA